MCVRARAFLAVIELLFGSVLKAGFYIMKWNVIYKCVCVCVCVCECVCVSARARFLLLLNSYSALS